MWSEALCRHSSTRATMRSTALPPETTRKTRKSTKTRVFLLAYTYRRMSSATYLLHARGKKTLKSYERAMKLLLAWCERHKNEDLIKEVTKMDGGVFQFDYKKLAESLESPNNVFFRYTLYYQIAEAVR